MCKGACMYVKATSTDIDVGGCHKHTVVQWNFQRQQEWVNNIPRGVWGAFCWIYGWIVRMS